MSRHLVNKFIFAVALAALLGTATGCKTSVTVTSNPPGAKAYVGPMSGSLWIVDSTEGSEREQYVGDTPVTVQSMYVWNEWGHAWARVEWPDGTKSTMKVRKPREAGPMTPAMFDFNEADYKNASANFTSTPAPAPVAPSGGLFGMMAASSAPTPAPAPSSGGFFGMVSTSTAAAPTPTAPSSEAASASTAPAPAATPSKPAVPASEVTASDLIGTWQNDEDTDERLVIHPNFTATWEIGKGESNGNINLDPDGRIRFDYLDHVMNKNNSLYWKIIDSQTISITRDADEVKFSHQ